MGLVAKAFQDIITFSRASAGTYVNSNGYITNSSVLNYLTYSNQADNAAWTKSNSFVQTNLLTYSQDFSNATWQVFGTASKVGSSILAPDGTLTAYEINVGTTGGLIDAASAIYQNTTATSAATTYTFSAWVQAKTGTVPFRLSGTTSTGNSAGTTDLTATTTWQRVAFTYTTTTAPVTPNIAFRAATAGGAVGNMYVWGAQLVQGSVPGNYQATTSAALPVLYADYNGVVRARKLCEAATTASHIVSTSVTVVAGTVYTLSVKLKAAERGFAQVRYENGGSTEFFAANVNLATGAYTTSTFGSPTQTNAVVRMLENGYWLISISAAASNTTFVTAVFVQSALGTNSYTGDGSSGIYIADAQLNEGSTALAYYDTTASAYNAPRFDYDPVTLAAKGLLIEESRANLLLQSNDFQTSWTPTNITRTLNSTLSPDGTVNGVKVAATAALSTVVFQSAIVAATAATGSVYVKQGTGATTANSFILRNNTTATNLVGGTFNYGTGVFTYTIGSTGVVVTNIGNGWWRIAITATAGITSGDSLLWYVGFSGGVQAAGDFLYAYGAQLEAGAFATSYMPTTTSQFTRAADVASVNTLSPWFNAAAGTLYAEADTFVPTSTSVLPMVSLSDGATSNNTHRLYSYIAKVGAGTNTAGVQVSDLQPLTYTLNTAFKLAYAFATNDFAASANGSAPLTDTVGGLPSGLTTLGLGSLVGLYWNGHLRRITYYPRRLTNAELQTLTTL